jgi:hypothetical protein
MLYESHHVLWANFHSGEIDTASALQWQSLKIVKMQTYKMALDFYNSFSNHASLSSHSFSIILDTFHAF